MEELRRKSWEDLHRLWWICVKERNRLATEAYERRRLNAGYGDYEAHDRERAVCFSNHSIHSDCKIANEFLPQIKVTQRAIKHALTERWYAWEAAYRIAGKEGLNLSGNGPVWNGE